MPIEKIIARILIAMAAVVTILTLIFYPWQYAGAPLFFLGVFVMADHLVPKTKFPKR